MGNFFDYSQNLFTRAGFRLHFVPLPRGRIDISKPISLSSISIGTDPNERPLPPALTDAPFDRNAQNTERCGLMFYDRLWRDTGILPITLSKTMYHDYLRSADHLDDMMPDKGGRTYRDEFASLVMDGARGLHPFELSTICGVGTFIWTSDDYVVVTKHPSSFHVYPDRWTFSASGSMAWGAYPHPFMEAVWRCRNELGHQVNLGNIEMVEFGVDVRKFFFEFCFIEHSTADSMQIRKVIEAHPEHPEFDMLRLKPVEERLTWMLDQLWEPAAAATLLMLFERVNVNGKQRLDNLLQSDEMKLKAARFEAKDEWDARGTRQELRRVMSTRYPAADLQKSSAKYINEILAFMGSDIHKSRVFEVGCGIGRLTERLAEKADRVVAVDICDRMLDVAENALKMRKKETPSLEMAEVEFRHGFAQDSLKPDDVFDVSICSLVLIHVCYDVDFEALVDALCRHSNMVFVFEDVTRRATSPYTKLRPLNDLRDAFMKRGFVVSKCTQTTLCGDQIALLKCVRNVFAVLKLTRKTAAAQINDDREVRLTPSEFVVLLRVAEKRGANVLSEELKESEGGRPDKLVKGINAKLGRTVIESQRGTGGGLRLAQGITLEIQNDRD